MQTRLKIALASAMTLGVSVPVLAEEASSTGTSPSAAVNHDFSVTVPEFLFFQVGSAGATIDLMDFAPTAANTGNGDDIAGTGGNAQAGAAASAEVRSNAGQVTITETNNGGGTGLSDGGTNTIAYSEILASTSDANLPTPTLSNAGGGTATPVLNSGDVTERTAEWTFLYSNTNVVAAGTYGTSTNGGRVTYTATTP